MKTSDLIEIGVLVIVVMFALAMLKSVIWYGLLFGGGYAVYKLVSNNSKQINK